MHHSLVPFNTVFVALFFVSVGMLVDIDFVLHHWGKVLSLALIALTVNMAINATVFKILGETWGDSLYTGAILAQIGEFSFVLAAVGASSMIISKENYQLAVAVIVVSLLLSPLLISRMRRYALGGDELHKEP